MTAIAATPTKMTIGGGNGQAMLPVEQVGEVVQVQLLQARPEVGLDHAGQRHAQQAGNDRPAQAAGQEQQTGAQQADQRVQPDLHDGADRRRLPEREELEQVGEKAHEDRLQVDGAVAAA